MATPRNIHMKRAIDKDDFILLLMLPSLHRAVSDLVVVIDCIRLF